MHFKISKEMKVRVHPDQEKLISSKDSIVKACQQEDVIAFDIYKDDFIIGFAMLRNYCEGCFFLWDYAIDCSFQNQGWGTAALADLIEFLGKEYSLKKLTTTYVWGNEHARHIYEKLGFIETEIVDEEGCHEVNMFYGEPEGAL
ncbi:MAG: GNAT family N-acetyltransferase [Bacillota bacterium]|nr:GNAT family N-acetyltransferase [Bacillota bacterium]